MNLCRREESTPASFDRCSTRLIGDYACELNMSTVMSKEEALRACANRRVAYVSRGN